MIGWRQDTSRDRGWRLGVLKPKAPIHPYPPPPSEGHRLGQRVDTRTAEAGERDRHWLSTGLILGAAVSLTALSAGNEFLLGAIAGPLLAATCLHGLWRGGLFKLLMLPAWCGLVFMAALRPGLPDLFIAPATGSPGLAWSAIVCLVVLIGALIIAGRTARGLRHRMMVGRRPGVLTLDRWLGALLGTVQGLFILLVVCWAVVLIEPQARAVLHHPNMPEESTSRRIASGIIRLTREINQTPLESMAHEANLLERVPFIRNALCDLAEGKRLALDSTNPARSKPRIETPPGAEPEQKVPPRAALAVKQARAKGGYRQQHLAGRSSHSSVGGGS